MEAIEKWFHSLPQGEDDDASTFHGREDPERNIPFRKNGRTIMLTKEEYELESRSSTDIVDLS